MATAAKANTMTREKPDIPSPPAHWLFVAIIDGGRSRQTALPKAIAGHAGSGSDRFHLKRKIGHWRSGPSDFHCRLRRCPERTCGAEALRPPALTIPPLAATLRPTPAHAALDDFSPRRRPRGRCLPPPARIRRGRGRRLPG